LLERLGRLDEGEASAGLNATVFRLRRRIESATTAAEPLAKKSEVGYLFRAPLRAI